MQGEADLSGAAIFPSSHLKVINCSLVLFSALTLNMTQADMLPED